MTAKLALLALALFVAWMALFRPRRGGSTVWPDAARGGVTGKSGLAVDARRMRTPRGHSNFPRARRAVACP